MALCIAVDGPVGAGKTTICDEVSKKLRIPHLDTGAMYRAAAVAVLRAGVDIKNETEAIEICSHVNIDVKYNGLEQITLLDGQNVNSNIRSEEVSMAASLISTYPEVRHMMVELQRRIAGNQDILVDGRDICTRVLPNATVKIFLTASSEERARRRWKQLSENGQETTYETVLRDLLARDKQDMNRTVDPLCKAEDAVLVDTTDMSFEESVQHLLKIINLKHKAANII